MVKYVFYKIMLMLVWVLLLKAVFVVQLGVGTGELAPATAGLSSVGKFSPVQMWAERESSFLKQLATGSLTMLQ